MTNEKLVRDNFCHNVQIKTVGKLCKALSCTYDDIVFKEAV